MQNQICRKYFVLTSETIPAESLFFSEEYTCSKAISKIEITKKMGKK